MNPQPYSRKPGWILDFNRQFGPILLLWICFFLRGAKTPATFFIWSLFVVLYIGGHLAGGTINISRERYWKEGSIAIVLAISQLSSKDPSVTLYYTLQGYLFLALWICLKSDTFVVSFNFLYQNLILLVVMTIVLVVDQYRHEIIRNVHGFFPVNPVFNAAWMASVSSVLVAYLLSKRTVPKRALQWIVALSAIATCILLPVRSALVGLAIGLLYACRRSMTWRRSIYVLALATFALAVIPKKAMVDRLRLGENNYRASIWTVALKVAAEHPWVGSGMGTFEMGYQRYAFPLESDPVRFSHTTSFAHNEFLQLASDLGFPAFLVISFGIASLFWKPSPFPSAHAAKAGFLVLASIAFYNIVWHLPFLLYLTLLLCRYAVDNDTLSHRSRSGTLQPLWTGMASTCLLGITLVLGWYALRQRLAANGQWQTILHWNSGDADAWENWAFGQRNSRLALQGFSRAVQLVPEQPYYREAYASALEASERPRHYQQAIQEYQTALHEAPGRANNALAIGRIYFLLENPTEALSWFKNALHREPCYWECSLWIARCLAKEGKIRQATSMLRDLKKRHTEFQIWLNRVSGDIPRPDELSGYEKTILAFDDRVIDQELELLRHSR